jgi:hypothetical protein
LQLDRAQIWRHLQTRSLVRWKLARDVTHLHYSINRLIVVMETEGVPCEVRTELVSIIRNLFPKTLSILQ